MTVYVEAPDVVKPYEAQPRQNKVWCGQQTARHECADAMSDPDPDVEIKFCVEVTCLGVAFDHELTFTVHIGRLAGKMLLQSLAVAY